MSTEVAVGSNEPNDAGAVRKSVRAGGGGGGEVVSRTVFMIAAALVVVIMATIFIFIGSNAYQTFTVNHESFGDFFFTSTWDPTDGPFIGAEAIIVGTIVTTLLALIIATPLSVGLAIFVTEIAPTWARRFMQP